jgi:prepilin-type processing-associated H-X9-DG protein
MGTVWQRWESVLGAGTDAYEPHAITVNAVSNGDGTSNTMLLAHKGVQPNNYNLPGTGPDDAGWAALACCDAGDPNPYGRNKSEAFEHKRYPFFFAQDANGTIPVNYGGGTFKNFPAEWIISSPHTGASPCVFVDGSVRMVSYSIDQGHEQPGQPPTLMTLLWTWNDGYPLSQLP